MQQAEARERTGGDLRVESDAESRGGPLEPERCELARPRGTVAARNRRADESHVGNEVAAPKANGLLVCQQLRVDLAGEAAAESVSFRAHDQRATVVVAREAEVLAHGTRFHRVIVQALAQQTRTRVIRLRDHLFAPEQVAHDDADLPVAACDRHVTNGERTFWKILLHAQGVVHIQLER